MLCISMDKNIVNKSIEEMKNIIPKMLNKYKMKNSKQAKRLLSKESLPMTKQMIETAKQKSLVQQEGKSTTSKFSYSSLLPRREFTHTKVKVIANIQIDKDVNLATKR